MTGTTVLAAGAKATKTLVRQTTNYVRCGDCGGAGLVARPKPGNTTFECDPGLTCGGCSAGQATCAACAVTSTCN